MRKIVIIIAKFAKNLQKMKFCVLFCVKCIARVRFSCDLFGKAELFQKMQ